MKPHQFTIDGKVLILKRIPASRRGYEGFLYPSGIGTKIVPDGWDPKPRCGGGIHGWPWGFGIGDGSQFDIIHDIWMVLSEVPENVVGAISNGMKCKCKEPEIVLEGSFKDAFAMVAAKWPEIVLGMASDGSGSNLAASGVGSTLSASGNNSTLAASGDRSVVSASGVGCVASVGRGGAFALAYVDTNGRNNFLIGQEGIDGIEANVPYCVKSNKIARA